MRKKIFKEKFEHRLDIGNEYFKGDYCSMIDIINTIIKNEYTETKWVFGRNNAETLNAEEGIDYLEEFVKDKIQKKIGSKIGKIELFETFKQWYTTNYKGRWKPKYCELSQFMDRRFGKYDKNRCAWHNILINYDEEPINNIEETEFLC